MHAFRQRKTVKSSAKTYCTNLFGVKIWQGRYGFNCMVNKVTFIYTMLHIVHLNIILDI